MHGKALKILAAIVVVLAVAFPFFLALEKISESDTFWHLKTGEWIMAHGAVPHADPFSATVNGKEWLDWEWLFQVGIYVLYSWGGFNALVVGKAIVVFLAGLVVFHDVSAQRGGSVTGRICNDGGVRGVARAARGSTGRRDAVVCGPDDCPAGGRPSG